MNQGEVRNLKGCLFSVIVDGILENTHPMGFVVPIVFTLKKQGKDKKIYTIETTPEGWEAFEHIKMSKEYQIKPGSRIEPVTFEPQRKIRLSRSTYKVNSLGIT